MRSITCAISGSVAFSDMLTIIDLLLNCGISELRNPRTGIVLLSPKAKAAIIASRPLAELCVNSGDQVGFDLLASSAAAAIVSNWRCLRTHYWRSIRSGESFLPPEPESQPTFPHTPQYPVHHLPTRVCE